MSAKWIRDTFVLGMLLGLATFFSFFYIFSFIRALIVNYYSNPYLLRPPAVHLLATGLNVILFRFLMINFNRENTGKGLLFVTVIISLAYFFFIFRYNK